MDWRDPLFPASNERMLPYLSRDAEGVLGILGHDAEKLLADHGSPLLLLLPERAADNVRSVRAAFGAFFPDVSVHYALKSCYYAPIACAALEAGAGVEVMSDAEMQIAEQAGFPDHLLVVNGLGRDRNYLRRGVSASGALHVLDFWDDFEALAAEAARQRRQVDVAVRVVPCMPHGLDNAMPLDSKLGNHVDDGEFWRLCDAVSEHPWMNLRGLHGHQFTRAASPADYGLFVAGLAAVVQEAYEQRNIRFEILDIGGGFDTRSVLEARGLPLSTFAEVAARELAVVPYPFRLVVEPGRYVSADAAVGLSRVRARRQRGQVTWQVVDLATNTLIPVPGAEYLPVPVRDGERRQLSRIGDGTCAPSVMCGDVALPATEPGTPLALLHCGAYTTVFAHVWGPRPPTVMALKASRMPELVTGPEEFGAAAKAVYGYELSLTPDA
ncbi:hypothetical protein [Streptomyces sp. NPDC048623]|uniref:diaminopimelate decarboxylase family protein n=1 Tax=Streptomyces sp. NPDC048623 TaxID=3155761 RepID=UPI00341CB376